MPTIITVALQKKFAHNQWSFRSGTRGNTVPVVKNPTKCMGTTFPLLKTLWSETTRNLSPARCVFCFWAHLCQKCICEFTVHPQTSSLVRVLPASPRTPTCFRTFGLSVPIVAVVQNDHCSQCTVRVQKIHPRTCGNFSKTVGNFSTKFYAPIMRSYLH